MSKSAAEGHIIFQFTVVSFLINGPFKILIKTKESNVLILVFVSLLPRVPELPPILVDIYSERIPML